MTIRQTPAFRDADREMVPTKLLIAMLALALASLALVSYSVLTGQPKAGVPVASEVVFQRQIILDGHSAQAVTVKNVDGTVLADLPHGGFITVIQSGLATIRHRHGIDPLLPVTITRYSNGRLVAEDPLTGWSAELYAFGGDNKAAFERLLSQ